MKSKLKIRICLWNIRDFRNR